jgi:hypothetical protein
MIVIRKPEKIEATGHCNWNGSSGTSLAAIPEVAATRPRRAARHAEDDTG